VHGTIAIITTCAALVGAAAYGAEVTEKHHEPRMTRTFPRVDLAGTIRQQVLKRKGV